METALTRKIKRGLAHFRLDMPTGMRTPRYAEEVWTPTGIVDFIRFEDVRVNLERKCKLIHHAEFPDDVSAAISPRFKLGECKTPEACFPNESCKNCVFRNDTYNIGRRVTCFEVKITLEDFKSQHGHNFHGHRNYYVVPKDLVHKIRDLVPTDIGIIAYYEASDSYRVLKECIERTVSIELEAELLYNAFKKWVDKFHFEYLHPSLVHESAYLSHNPGIQPKEKLYGK